MEDTNRVYRIRTAVGEDAPNVIHVPLRQSYDMFEILSLKINQTNTYKTYESDYGIIVGRVTANGGFGVPNAKVSIFIEVSDDDTLKDRLLYNFTSTSDTDNDGVRYNLLPDFVDDGCHQNVGTFPNKRLVLDNKDVIDMFDRYWKYTTTTNHAGDYMIYGVPTGSQQLHVDVDLSDCGILSQRPRDMIEKGYDVNMFESPNKFKTSSNLNSLAQIISQDRGVYVYPYWGDASDGEDKFSITRCDVNLEYKFESYAVFMGSIVTDKGANAIGKNCTGTEQNGNMSDLIAGEGTIEMIRKTIDGKVEEFPIMGNRLIDGDGIWCYQVPMNLDYVTTDEFGSLVPTDNPEKGIATRTRVRFRISLDENPSDALARKRARYLVPNNPRMGEGDFDDVMDADYEFGSATREESYCDMFWGKVYTVKNYIPKLQKNSKESNRKHTGIKLVNHYGDNNPMPYNSLVVKLNFTYRIICVVTKVIINLIEFLNEVISIIGGILCLLIAILELPMKIFKPLCKLKIITVRPFGWICSLWQAIIAPVKKLIELILPDCIGLSSEFCDDGINQVTYYPGCGYFLFRLFRMPHGFIDLDCVWAKTEKNHTSNQLKICENEKKTPEDCEMSLTEPSNATAMLYNCIENQLAQQHDVTSFNFYNDWVNGVLYAPLWYRKIRKKKSYFFGLIRRKAKDDWCSSQRSYPGMRLLQHCVVKRETDGNYRNFDGDEVDYKRVINYRCDSKCHKEYKEKKGMNGVIVSKQTMMDETVYYYKAVEYDPSLPKNPLYRGEKEGDVKLMFATDIVLLGSLNECDMNGIPQFFKALDSTTYNMPTDILFTDYDFIMTVNSDTGDSERMEYTVTDLVKTSESAGCDWGNPNEFDKYDGGLFYSIGCASGSTKLDTKSCINLSRICEYGVSLDETKEVADLSILANAREEEIDIDSRYYQKLITDGFISWDELYNIDERSMFATMNGNRLKTRLNERNGLYEYDFRYLYPENFDGSLKEIMEGRTGRYANEINYKDNYKLEEKSRDYYIFRMGNRPYYYDTDFAFPRYENSFYFYFGLKAGKTAIEKFNSKYFSECVNPITESQIGIKFKPNDWCSDVDGNNGYLALSFTSVPSPYSLMINGVSDAGYSLEIDDITEESVIIIGNYEDRPSSLRDYAHLKGEEIEDGVWRYSENGSAIPMMDNGAYKATLTDSEGTITDFTFNILGSYLTYKIAVNNFEQSNSTLSEIYGGSYDAIASDKTGVHDEGEEKKDYNREIGGTLTVYDVFMNGERLNDYKVEVAVKNGTLGDYGGVSVRYSGGSVSYAAGETTALNRSEQSDVQHYAFGLPKGGTEYTVTVTQMCGDTDSANSVSTDFYVSEPLPYKMYINGIDYDVIRQFDGNTGWNMTGNVSSHIASEGTLSMSNPWFRTDSIYYSDSLADGIENDKIVSFGVDKDDNRFYATDADGNTYNVSGAEVLRQEFCTERSGDSANGVPYTWVDRYLASDEAIDWQDSSDVYEKIDRFVADVNSVLSLRRELRDMVKDTFFINCEGDAKSIIVSGRTSSLPCTETVVYHPEKAVENEDYNVLDGDSLVDEDKDTVDDMRIPTITYGSSDMYGDGSGSDAPCLASVDGIRKKPYSCAIMNNSGISIPKKGDGQPFAYIENNGVKYIDHTSTQFADLFSFPIIDNILRVDYIAWSAFVNIPKYGYENGEPRKAAVTMNGLLAGTVYNGNASGDEFDTQSLNDIRLMMSQNITDETQTYVRKRVINGYDYDEIGNWAISALKSYINSGATEEMISMLNSIISPISVTVDNVRSVLNSIVVEDGTLKYGSLSVDISAVTAKILSFTDYRVSDDSRVEGTQQYAFVLPAQTYIQIQDADMCGVEEIIDGSLKVTLDDESVNDCRENGQKILKVSKDEGSVYSIFRTNADGEGYPINLADNTGSIVWQIDDTIDDVYSTSKPQNLLSYQTKTSHLRGEGDLVDRMFMSQFLVSGDSDEEVYEDTMGYGTTGEFKPVMGFSYPVFIVSESESHVRALSPVYDFSDVYGLIKYGVLERKDVEQTVDEETGETVYNVLEPTTDYKFGIAVKEGHYYLDNYRYKISGTCRIDDINTIDVAEQTVSSPRTFAFSTISENMYTLLKSRFVMAGPLMTGVMRRIIENTEIRAVDYTGLRHICGLRGEDLMNAETKWYTYIWNVNMPKDTQGNPYPASIANGGILYEGEYYDYLEFNYEDGDEIEPMEGRKGSTLGINFLGWSENQPDKNNLITFSGDTLTAAESRVYFGNWDVAEPEPPAPERYTVTFYDENGAVISELTKQYDKGSIVEKPGDSYEDRVWYIDGHEATEWPYTVNGDMSFSLANMFIVTWSDDDTDITDAPVFSVVFKKEIGGEVLNTDTVTAGNTASLSGIAINYNWYIEGDTSKTYVDFPYVVNDNVTFIGVLKDVDTTVFRIYEGSNRYTLSYEAQEVDVVIETLVDDVLRDFTVTTSTAWLGYIKSSEHDEFDRTITFTITVTQNNESGDRSGYLILKQNDSTLPTIRIDVLQKNRNTEPGTISMKWKLINNRTVGLPIESIHTYFNDDISIFISSGGSVPLNGGVREGTSNISDTLSDVELVCQRIEISPDGGYPDLDFEQSPSPYKWSTNGQGGYNPMIITIKDKNS